MIDSIPVGDRVFGGVRKASKYISKNLKTFYLYKDCSEIPIFNFDVIYKTGNLKYMVVDYNGYSDVRMPKEANENWQSIKNEWMDLIDDNEMVYYFQLVLECSYLQTRYNLVGNILENIYTRKMDEETLETYIDALSEWRYKWNRKSKKLVEVKRLLQQWKSSKNKLGIKLDELDKMNKKYKNLGDASSLEKQAAIIEQITGKNVIDLKTTSVKKWFEICKIANDINEQKKKNVK